MILNEFVDRRVDVILPGTTDAADAGAPAQGL
jgi:hypothetical protein